MRLTLVVFAFALQVSAVASLTAYPATYPFENEAYWPPTLIAATKSYTYDPDTDEGGYYYGGQMCDMNLYSSTPRWTDPEDGLFYWMQYCEQLQYWHVNTYQHAAILPDTVYNCSAGVFSQEDYIGEIGGQAVCTPGNCCQFLMGHDRYVPDTMMGQNLYSTYSESGLCGAMNEQAMCWASAFGAFICTSRFLNAYDRLFMIPCHDSMVLWFLDCKVYKNTGIFDYVSTHDPPSYISQLSVEQTMVEYSMWSFTDRVCHPYSYYEPESAASPSDSGSSGSSSSGSSSAAASDSSAATLVFSLATFLSLAAAV